MKVSLKNEVEIKIYPVKQKLRSFATIRPTLKNMLKGVLPVDMKGSQRVTQKLCEQIKVSSKGNYVHKYKDQYDYCMFAL